MKNFIKILIIAATTSLMPAFANDPMTESLTALKGVEFDQAFLSMMIEHHQQGIQMAQLASSHGQSAALKTFAEKTISMQKKDITEMKTMLGTSTSAKSTLHHDESHEKMQKEMMSRLQNSMGTDFDRMFVQEMLMHHKTAIEMARLAKSKSTREDVRAFADKTIEMQGKESQALTSLGL